MILLLAAAILVDPSASSIAVTTGGSPGEVYAVRVEQADRGSIEADAGAEVVRDGTTYHVRRASSGGSSLIRVVVKVPCCVPLAVDVGYGSLDVSATENQLRAHVESGSLDIDLTKVRAQDVTAQVDNGSLEARLLSNATFALRAHVENGPPETWSDGSSLASASALHATRERTSHGATLALGHDRPVVQLGVTNGTMRIDSVPKPVDGIRCDRMEGAEMHVHSMLRIINRGTAVPIPSDIGRPASTGCLYWIHTHTADGVIHVEAPVAQGYTLGELADIWGTSLDDHHAAGIAFAQPIVAYVNGKRWRGSLREIPLWPHADIQLISGKNVRPLPAFNQWGDL